MKATSLLLVAGMIQAVALGQASTMISISALRQQSEVASAYSRADIEQLMKTAHSSEDFSHLADYLENQAEMYACRYEEEQKEMDRLLALHYHARSYPAQLENARNRMAHFKELCRKSNELAQMYRARASAERIRTALAVK